MENAIKTPQTHPDHSTVGHHFAGPNWDKGTQIYYCDSYDPRSGFWMTNINDPLDRKNVSERAINATFHPAVDRDTHWWVSTWSARVRKGPLENPPLPAPGKVLHLWMSEIRMNNPIKPPPPHNPVCYKWLRVVAENNPVKHHVQS